jgi:DNA-binding LacI/PurR family transcriptional regulator
VRRVAAEAGVDPRTVDRYLARERITSTALDRIERALELFGWTR